MPRILLATFAAAFFLALPQAHADETTKRAKVEQLFVLTRVDATMSQMFEQMSSAMKASMEEQKTRMHLTPEQVGYTQAFTARVDAIMKNSLSMDTLKPTFLKVYMETYTEEELDGILAFYRSPAGQAFVAKNPILMQRSIELMQQQIRVVQPQLEEAQKELMQQMEKTEKTEKPATRPQP